MSEERTEQGGGDSNSHALGLPSMLEDNEISTSSLSTSGIKIYATQANSQIGTVTSSDNVVRIPIYLRAPTSSSEKAILTTAHPGQSKKTTGLIPTNSSIRLPIFLGNSASVFPNSSLSSESQGINSRSGMNFSVSVSAASSSASIISDVITYSKMLGLSDGAKKRLGQTDPSNKRSGQQGPQPSSKKQRAEETAVQPSQPVQNKIFLVPSGFTNTNGTDVASTVASLPSSITSAVPSATLTTSSAEPTATADVCNAEIQLRTSLLNIEHQTRMRCLNEENAARLRNLDIQKQVFEMKKELYSMKMEKEKRLAEKK